MEPNMFVNQIQLLRQAQQPWLRQAQQPWLRQALER